MASQALTTTVKPTPKEIAEYQRRQEVIRVLRTSQYPGASAAAVAGVIDYCKAAGLNPMLKPVHIVPMYVKSKDASGRDTSGMREVIMPGIAHYRTQASRSGRYVGKSAPEWGPTVELKLGSQTVSVPEWCRMTVKVRVGTEIAEFTAEERWIENYATAGRDKPEPNAMWFKRPNGQLAKVTEAQALRMAFPELVGGVETAEEMEGKTLGGDAETLVGKAGAAPVIRNANAALDNFAGVRTDQALIDGELAEGQKTDVFGLKSIEDVDAAAAGFAAKEAAKPAAKAAGKPKAAAAGTLPLDDGAKPEMPGGARNDWEMDGNWEGGWRWLCEALPKAAPAWRQELVDDNVEMLRSVASASDAYAKAVNELLTRTETSIA